MIPKTASKAFTRGTVALFCVAFLVVATTFSAYADSSFVNSKQKTTSAAYVVPPSNCYTTLYTLSKTKAATSKCLVPGKMVNGKKVAVTSSGKVIPYTSTSACSWFLSKLEIDSAVNGQVCFTGSGYLAIRLDKVSFLSTQTTAGWVRLYNPTGITFYFQWWSTYWCSPFCSALITQVYID